MRGLAQRPEEKEVWADLNRMVNVTAAATAEVRTITETIAQRLIRPGAIERRRRGVPALWRTHEGDHVPRPIRPGAIERKAIEEALDPDRMERRGEDDDARRMLEDGELKQMEAVLETFENTHRALREMLEEGFQEEKM